MERRHENRENESVLPLCVRCHLCRFRIYLYFVCLLSRCVCVHVAGCLSIIVLSYRIQHTINNKDIWREKKRKNREPQAIIYIESSWMEFVKACVWFLATMTAYRDTNNNNEQNYRFQSLQRERLQRRNIAQMIYNVLVFHCFFSFSIWNFFFLRLVIDSILCGAIFKIRDFIRLTFIR